MSNKPKTSEPGEEPGAGSTSGAESAANEPQAAQGEEPKQFVITDEQLATLCERIVSGLIPRKDRSTSEVAPGQVENWMEGELRTDRATYDHEPDPRYYYCTIERLPREWQLPDRVRLLLESGYGFEIVGDPSLTWITLRCPIENYHKMVAIGERAAEERRRAKVDGAAVDKVDRRALNLGELFQEKDAQLSGDLVKKELEAEFSS